MREFKFRGISKYNGEWVYGDLLTERNKISKDSAIVCYDGNVIPKSLPVIKDTIGQWIGTIDKNKIDVYEDDILQDDNGKIYRIVWGTDLLWLAITKEKSCCTYCPKGISKRSVIIGNMKENPELWR